MKLALIADDGTIVDTTDEFTREEWDRARNNSLGSMFLLADLNADAS